MYQKLESTYLCMMTVNWKLTQKQEELQTLLMMKAKIHTMEQVDRRKYKQQMFWSLKFIRQDAKATDAIPESWA